MKNNLTVGFFGLTHLGTCSSIAAAMKNINVIACDTNSEIYYKRKSGIFDKAEPGVDNFLKKPNSFFKLTNEIQELQNCDLIYVSIDAPVNILGEVDVTPVKDYYFKLIEIIPESIPIIILSQVNPGFTRQLESQRKNTYYQMETLIFGQGIERALSPERYVLGSADKEIPDSIRNFLSIDNCELFIFSYESAELSKLAANFFLASTITATNTLSELATKLGADWNDIAGALKMDKRIGKYAYLKPGLGIGGSNIIRDLVGLKKLASHYATESSLIDSMVINSNYMLKWISRTFSNSLTKLPNRNINIGLLGLSYKKDTDSIIRSSGLDFLKNFSKKFRFNVFDPVVTKINDLPDSITWNSNYRDVIEVSDILIIATPWDEFQTSNFIQAIEYSKIKILIDPYGCVNALPSPTQNISHIVLGKGGSI